MSKEDKRPPNSNPFRDNFKTEEEMKLIRMYGDKSITHLCKFSKE
jgi:hypothetical protein